MPNNMNVEPLYQGHLESVDPSKVALFLYRLLVVLWWTGWAGLALFILSFAMAILMLFGLDILAPVFEETTPLNAMTSSLTMTVGVIVFLIVVKQLRLICQTLVTGDPFVPDNSYRLRIIWIALATVEIMRLLFGVLLKWLRTNTDVSMNMATDISATVWFMVMVLIILAEVFREGVRMRQEAKLTV